MPTPDLTPEQKTELTGVVQRMKDAGEPDTNIQSVVDHYVQTKTSAAPEQPAQPESSYGVGDAALDVVKGVGAGLASTVYHGGDLIRRGLGMERIINNPIPQAAMKAPDSIAGTVGKAGEQIGEFFLPSGEVGTAVKAFTTGSKLANVGIRAALEGASAAGVSTLQSGSPEEGAKTGAVTAGMTAAMGPVAPAMKWLGDRVERALVKAGSADVADGFKVGNIFKYDLGGTLEQSYQKAQDKIGALADRTKELIRQSGVVGSDADIAGVMQRARQSLMSNPARTFGTNTQIAAAFDKLESEPFLQAIIKKGGKAGLDIAQDMKIAMGDMGAWLHDPSGKVIVDPDSKAMEKVANTVYDELKKEIQNRAIGPIGDLNRQMSELIPIRRALIRRIPVAARANVFNMGDLLSFANGGWKLSLANRIMQSGRTANALVKAAPYAAAAAPGVGRVVGAATENTDAQ